MNSNCATENNFGCLSPPDAKLIAEGWERRFIADANRAVYAMGMYEELGHEVRIEPINLEQLKEECSECLVILKQLRAVYTRKKI